MPLPANEHRPQTGGRDRRPEVRTQKTKKMRLKPVKRQLNKRQARPTETTDHIGQAVVALSPKIKAGQRRQAKQDGQEKPPDPQMSEVIFSRPRP